MVDLELIHHKVSGFAAFLNMWAELEVNNAVTQRLHGVAGSDLLFPFNQT
jgi:hypothetical protein